MIFCPKTTTFGPKLAFLVNLGQAMQASSVPCFGSAGGCGARAVSRKTPIYFIYLYIQEATICQLLRKNVSFEHHSLLTAERWPSFYAMQWQRTQYASYD